MLAEACEGRGIDLLCLGHTLDDRVETLRMRANRTGGWRTLTGMTALDPSPVWPEGRTLQVARPFLHVRREALRHWLRSIKADWLEDPSNENRAFERVRLRAQAYDPGSSAEAGLISLSDQSLDAERLLRASAWRLFNRTIRLEAWGGAYLHSGLTTAVEPVALRALEAAILAVSGKSEPPAPQALKRFLEARDKGHAMTAAGVLLSADGYLGRDPGAVLGRSDGGIEPAHLKLEAGDHKIFDGRWQGHAQSALHIRALGEGRPPEHLDVRSVPRAHRPALTCLTDSPSGEAYTILGLDDELASDWTRLGDLRVQRWLQPPTGPSWFDGKKCASIVGVTLAKPL